MQGFGQLILLSFKACKSVPQTNMLAVAEDYILGGGAKKKNKTFSYNFGYLAVIIRLLSNQLDALGL